MKTKNLKRPRQYSVIVLYVILFSLCKTGDLSAQGYTSLPEEIKQGALIKDRNGDGAIVTFAFGDSITRGVGDFIESGTDVQNMGDFTLPDTEAGYPLRVEAFLGLGVNNRGEPGERITGGTLPRLVEELRSHAADLVIIGGGSNDAAHAVSGEEVFVTAQTMINISRASGSEVALIKIIPSFGNHSSLNYFTQEYNRQYDLLAAVNGVTLVPLDRAFNNVCPDYESDCPLLNTPEGLHPNIEGYDVMGEMITASILGIDLLVPGNSLVFEQVLGLVPGSTKTVPDPATAAP